MTEYKNLKKKSVGALGIIIALLIVLELCALAMLFSRLTGFSGGMSGNVFSLTETGGRTTVRKGYIKDDGSVEYEDARLQNLFPLLLTDIAGFTPLANVGGGGAAQDKDTIWEGTTNVEIFKVSYENGEGKITVDGGGDNVVAPGTSNEFIFTLENPVGFALDYTMEMDAFFSSDETAIPIKVRLVEKNGDYLVGSEGFREDIDALNGVHVEDTLGSGKYVTYGIDWEWAFEGDDEYDTMLGNLAVEGKSFSLTIVIRTTAMQSADPDCSDGEDTPVLGDDGSFVWWFVIALLALVGLALVFKTKKAQAEIIYNEENQ